eukprot:364262-Chlamydomonas_euryale.AAC.16
MQLHAELQIAPIHMCSAGRASHCAGWLGCSVRHVLFLSVPCGLGPLRPVRCKGNVFEWLTTGAGGP